MASSKREKRRDTLRKAVETMPRKKQVPKATVPDELRPRESLKRQIAARKAAFLEHYMRTGRVCDATAAIGVHYNQAHVWARVDEAFAKAWDEAREIAADRLEDAAFARSVDGVQRPIYQNGKLMGFEQRFSDTLTMFLLRGLRPEKYRDRSDVRGDVNVVSWTELVRAAKTK